MGRCINYHLIFDKNISKNDIEVVEAMNKINDKYHNGIYHKIWSWEKLNLDIYHSDKEKQNELYGFVKIHFNTLNAYLIVKALTEFSLLLPEMIIKLNDESDYGYIIPNYIIIKNGYAIIDSKELNEIYKDYPEDKKQVSKLIQQWKNEYGDYDIFDENFWTFENEIKFHPFDFCQKLNLDYYIQEGKLTEKYKRDYLDNRWSSMDEINEEFYKDIENEMEIISNIKQIFNEMENNKHK